MLACQALPSRRHSRLSFQYHRHSEVAPRSREEAEGLVAGGPRGEGDPLEVAEAQALPPAQRPGVGDAWGVMTAVNLMKVGLHLQRELMEEKIFHFITEWPVPKSQKDNGSSGGGLLCITWCVLIASFSIRPVSASPPVMCD